MPGCRSRQTADPSDSFHLPRSRRSCCWLRPAQGAVARVGLLRLSRLPARPRWRVPHRPLGRPRPALQHLHPPAHRRLPPRARVPGRAARRVRLQRQGPAHRHRHRRAVHLRPPPPGRRRLSRRVPAPASWATAPWRWRRAVSSRRPRSRHQPNRPEALRRVASPQAAAMRALLPAPLRPPAAQPRRRDRPPRARVPRVPRLPPVRPLPPGTVARLSRSRRRRT